MKKLLRFSVSEYKQYPGRSATILLLMFITLGYQMLFSLAFKYLIDHILAPKQYEHFSLLLSAVILGAIIASISNLLTDYHSVKLGVAVENKLRLKLFHHLQQLPESFYAKKNTHAIHSRSVKDLDNVVSAFLSIQPIVYSVLGITVSITILFSLDWRLTVLAIIGVPITLMLPRFVHTYLNKIYASYQPQTHLGFEELFYDRIAGHSLFRTFGLKNWEYERMEAVTEDTTPFEIKTQFTRKLLHKSVVVALLLLNMIIISFGAFLVMKNRITIGDLVAFQSFFRAISGYLSALSRSFPSLVKNAFSFKKLESIFHEPISLEDNNEPKLKLQTFKEEIRFNDVSFNYSEGQIAIQHVNMAIPFLSKCAIVGPSGSGKTTITSLLLRLNEPTSGNITLDYLNIKEISPDSFRQLIGYVPQDVILLNLSIKENIKIGNLEATDEDVEKAAKLAGIHNWIMSLPNNYHYFIQERGKNLSGGQIQKIAIARALIRKPPILILDEATSSLDPGTENLINHTIHTLLGTSTIISITHRIQSIIDSDIIFVMDYGKLVSFGTHTELLTSCEKYKKMWVKQSGFTISANGKQADMTVERLKLIELFSEIDAPILEEIIGYMKTEYYKDDQIVVEQGDEGDTFYIIVRGQVEVLLKQTLNQEKRLAILEDGDYFGEMALMKEIPRTATVRTLTPCTFLSMKRSHFQKILEKSDHFRQNLENTYDIRLATQNEDLASLQHNAPN